MENGHVSLDDDLLGYTGLNQEVGLFNFGNVIVRKDYKECDNVRLISGGSVLYEKFVGKGMLTATVQGENEAFPTSKLIVRVIRELSVNHYKGVLVIVQGDSSDILNFGLAVERAVNDDLGAMILGVSDDSLNREFSRTNKRGLSGIVLVMKIAGSMAANGASLNEVHEFCNQILENLSSSSAHIGNKSIETECVVCKKCEQQETAIEPSLKKSRLSFENKLPHFNAIINDMYTDILREGKLNLNSDTGNNFIVILINNQGGLDSKEEYLFVKQVISYFESCEIQISRLYIGRFLELNYKLDLSLTILKVFHKDILKHLDESCNAPGWKNQNQHSHHLTLENIIPGCLKRKCRLSPPIKGPKLKDRPTNVLQLCVQFACDAIISCSRMLDKFDAESGDGDTGSRLKNVADILHKRIKEKKLILNYPFTFFLSLSKILENAVGGTLGCIYSILFEAGANKFGQYNETDDVTPFMWLEALENGCQSVKKFGNTDFGDQTMYDPLYMCGIKVRECLTQNPEDYVTAFQSGVAEAEKAAQKTRRDGCRYPNPGAHAVGIWMRAVCEGVKLRCSI